MSNLMLTFLSPVMLQTSLLTDRKSLGYNNICVAEIRDNAASGCG